MKIKRLAMYIQIKNMSNRFRGRPELVESDKNILLIEFRCILLLNISLLQKMWQRSLNKGLVLKYCISFVSDKWQSAHVERHVTSRMRKFWYFKTARVWKMVPLHNTDYVNQVQKKILRLVYCLYKKESISLI